MTEDLLFDIRELASVYALKTLYDHLAAEEIDANLFFDTRYLTSRGRKILGERPLREFDCSSIDRVISASSDTMAVQDEWPAHFCIDASILKSCDSPLDDSHKLSLRRKHGISSSKPVMVVSYASYEGVPDLVKATYEHADIFLVTFKERDLREWDLPSYAESSVHFVTEYGVLKDYYSMADLSVVGVNMERSDSKMHNFIEAIAGGPLFMVRPEDTAQYGYQECVDLNLIRECSDTESLIESVRDYALRSDEPSTTHLEKRNGHLIESRGKFLPVITKHLMHELGLIPEAPLSDLIVERDSKGLSLKHPVTNWNY